MTSQTNRYLTRSLILTVLTILSLFLISCTSGNNVNVEFEDGISEPIRELLGDDLLNVLENDLGLPIYRGKNPPDIESILLSSSLSEGEATVRMDPTILETTNVPNDGITPGERYGVTILRFANMDGKNLTIDFDRIVLGSGSAPFIGPNSYIIGKGKKFSVFGKQLDIVEQDTVVSVNFLSGIVEDDGISMARGGIIVVENHGIEVFIPNGTGRVFKDDDDFSEIDEWPSTGSQNFFETSQSTVDGFDLNHIVR